MAMEITILGANTLPLRKSSSALLVDPHFTRPNVLKLVAKIHPDRQIIAEGLARSGISRLDGVLLTHTHYDHALDAAEVIHRGLKRVSTLGARYGQAVHRLEYGAPITL